MGNCASPAKGVELSFAQSYAIQNEVGSGATASVFQAKAKAGPSKGQTVAVKVINKKKFTSSENDALLKEVDFLKELNHPHIIKFHNFFDEGPEKSFLVLEMVNGGELFDRISEKTVYNEKEARDLIATLLDVLVHLEEHKMVHRDLKPENLLLKNRENDSDIVLIDFGFAEKANGRSLYQQCGTPNYVAPEVLAKRSYGCEVDLWSAGVIAYILLGGYPPFYTDSGSNDELFSKILKAEYTFDPEWWDPVSPGAKDLISKMLVVDQDKRLTPKQCLRHEWFLSDDNELLEKVLAKSLEGIKSWNAKRKFKGAVKAVILTNKLKRLTMLGKASAAAEGGDVEAPPSSSS